MKATLLKLQSKTIQDVLSLAKPEFIRYKNIETIKAAQDKYQKSRNNIREKSKLFPNGTKVANGFTFVEIVDDIMELLKPISNKDEISLLSLFVALQNMKSCQTITVQGDMADASTYSSKTSQFLFNPLIFDFTFNPDTCAMHMRDKQNPNQEVVIGSYSTLHNQFSFDGEAFAIEVRNHEIPTQRFSMTPVTGSLSNQFGSVVFKYDNGQNLPCAPLSITQSFV